MQSFVPISSATNSYLWQIDVEVATHVIVEDDGPKRRFDSDSF
jgi:hypothetical protein